MPVCSIPLNAIAKIKTAFKFKDELLQQTPSQSAHSYTKECLKKKYSLILILKRQLKDGMNRTKQALVRLSVDFKQPRSSSSLVIPARSILFSKSNSYGKLAAPTAVFRFIKMRQSHDLPINEHINQYRLRGHKKNNLTSRGAQNV